MFANSKYFEWLLRDHIFMQARLLYAKGNKHAKVMVQDKISMRGSRKFCQNLALFLVDEGREDQNTTINESSSAKLPGR